jgi:hypothetical protein
LQKINGLQNLKSGLIPGAKFAGEVGLSIGILEFAGFVSGRWPTRGSSLGLEKQVGKRIVR